MNNKLMKEKFFNRIHFVVLATDISHSKQYILSTNESDIELPYIDLTNDLLDNLEKKLVKHLQSFVFANELELLPQLITMHSKIIESENHQINTVYGFVLKKTDSINNSFWIEFSYGESNKYSNLIFETIQKLK